VRLKGAPSFLLLALLAVAHGCTFEERGNGLADPAGPGEASVLGEDVEELDDPGAAALRVVRTFRDAAATGDLSLALALMHRDATLTDELAGSTDEERTRGEMLLESRARLSDGVSLRESSTHMTLSDGVAVVLSRLTVEPQEGVELPSGSDLPAELIETVVLVPGADGWTVLHLHRSAVVRTP
jgi:hypothetical protein